MEKLRLKKKEICRAKLVVTRFDHGGQDTGKHTQVSERFLTIIYLVFVQMRPLTTYFVFDKFFLQFFPIIKSCFGFIWQMASTVKTFQSMQRKSHEFNGAQADFNAVFTSAKTVIILLTAREACFILQCFHEKAREDDMVQ